MAYFWKVPIKFEFFWICIVVMKGFKAKLIMDDWSDIRAAQAAWFGNDKKLMQQNTEELHEIGKRTFNLILSFS